MKQLIITGPRHTEIIEVPIPEINDEQMLVRLTLTGMCHSEFHRWNTGKVSEMMENYTDGFIKGAFRC